MKRIIFIAVALVLVLALNGFAQEKQKQAPAAGMATTDVQKQEIKTIFNYRTDLGLTDKQVADIKKLLLDLQNIFVEKVKEINALRQELNQMLKDRKDLRTIRRKIEEIAKIQVDNTYRDIEASRKIENTLNPEQLKKWQDIQRKTREKAQAEAAESKAKQAESKAKQEPAAKPKK